MKIDDLCSKITQRPYLSLVLTLAFIACLVPGLLSFQEQYDVRVWFKESDPNIKVLDAFERQFGNDENIVIIAHSKDGIISNEGLKVVDELTQKMWGVHEVIRVDSLTNHNIITAENDDIKIGPLFEERTTWSQNELKNFSKKANADPLIPNYLLSKDQKTAMIFARLAPTLESSPSYKKIVKETRDVIQGLDVSDAFTFHLAGEAAVNDAFREISTQDGIRLLPLLILLSFIFLYFNFRSLFASALPLFIMGASTSMSLGLCFYLDMHYNEVLSILPGILMAISTADSLHIMMSYFQFRAQSQDPKEASRKSLIKNFTPTLLTTVSTMIGFFSLTLTELEPIRQLGILAGFGSACAWILSYGILGPILATVSFKVPKSFYKVKKSRSHLYLIWVRKHHKSIVFCFIAAFCFSLWLGKGVVVNSNPYLYFREHIPIRVANDFVQEQFGGNSGPEIMIYSDSKKSGGIKEPDFLNKVDKFKTWLEGREDVNKVVDIVGIIKDINSALNNDEKGTFVLAQTRESIAQQIFLYTMSLPQGMEINNRVNINEDALRMTVIWNIFDTVGWLEQVEVIEKKAKELGLNIETTGKFLLFQRMMGYVVWTFLSSLIMAVILIGLLLSFLFGSFKLGLFSLIPNLFPIVFGAAFMKIFGIDLNIGSSLVASVCLGIAVDDTIHFLTHYYKALKDGLNVNDALENVFKATSRALIMTTLILVSGFGLYTMGDFVPNMNFGLLSAIALGSALAVDLIFLPALIFLINSNKKRPS